MNFLVDARGSRMHPDTLYSKPGGDFVYVQQVSDDGRQFRIVTGGHAHPYVIGGRDAKQLVRCLTPVSDEDVDRLGNGNDWVAAAIWGEVYHSPASLPFRQPAETSGLASAVA